MGTLSSIFGRRASASLESVTFDASCYEIQGDRDGTRIWFLPGGGGVGLFFFPGKPGLPAVTSTEHLREFYAAQMGDGGGQVVECRVLPLDGIRSIWLIVKNIDEESRGSVYVGSLTIPFRAFSFVIKVQCHEQGITGIRETLLLDQAFGNGTAKIEDGRLVLTCRSFDDEMFDDKFPKHPLSRVRRELRHIASSLQIDPTIRDKPAFELPRDDT